MIRWDTEFIVVMGIAATWQPYRKGYTAPSKCGAKAEEQIQCTYQSGTQTDAIYILVWSPEWGNINTPIIVKHRL